MTDKRAALLLVFFASIAFRLAIFYPNFIPNVDAAEFATFVREISLNSGAVPSTNTLYFPGSTYIYPPFLFLFTYYLDLPFQFIFGASPWLHMYTLFFTTVVCGAIMNISIYRNTADHGNRYSMVLSFIIPVFFGVDLYALTWGGFPYIVDTTFFVLLLFLLDKEKWGRLDYVFAVLLSVLIPMTHDLTWFLMASSMLVILIFNLLKRRREMVVRSLLVFIVTAIAGLVWWLPRINFVLGALSLNQATGSGLFSPVGPGAYSILLAIPYAIPIIVLVLLEIFGSIKSRRIEKVDSFTLVFATTAVGLIFLLKDPVVAARVVLYSYTMLMIIVLKNVHVISPLKSEGRKSERLKKIVKVTIMIFVVVGIPSQFIIGSVSSNYYSSGGFVYDQKLVSWAETNMQNGTVAAPEIGNYLSAISGNHVIIYSGFLVGTYQINQRNAVFDLIFHPHNASTQQNVSKFNIKYLVVLNGDINSTVDGQYVNLHQYPFTLMHRFQYYSVYSVSYS